MRVSQRLAWVGKRSMKSRGMWTSVLGGVAALAAFVIVGALSLKPKSIDNGTAQLNTVSQDEAKVREAAAELNRILRGMDPTRLDITTKPEDLVNELNTWFTEFGPKEGVAPLAQDAEVINRILQGEALRRTLQKPFSVEDASAIREALLTQKIVASVTANLPTDAERAIALFQFVVRQMSLIPTQGASPLPLSPHESLLFNIGTRDDRIWTFASLLRQMRLDAVVLTPRQEGMTNNLLVGVLTSREGILLFDPQMGLPIPGPADDVQSPEVTSVATLEQVLASDEPFRKLDLPDEPYPLNSAVMKRLYVEVVGTPSTWSPRFAELQFRLPPGIDVVLHDGLGKSDARPQGQWDRAVAAGQEKFWSASDVSVWKFPDRALRVIAALKGKRDPRFEALLDVFRGPTHLVRKSKDKNDPPVEEYAERPLRVVRIEQLTGDYAGAIRDYVAIRSMGLGIPKDTNSAAVRYATVWSGVCQLQRNERTAAIATFTRFLETYPGDQGLARWSAEWQSLALAESGKFAQAVEVLRKAPRSHFPNTDLWLIRRWERAAAPANAPAVPNAEQPAAEQPARAE